MKVSTMSRLLTAYSQNRGEGARYYSEADELHDLFELGDTPTASRRNSSPGAGQGAEAEQQHAPNPLLLSPMKVNAGAAPRM